MISWIIRRASAEEVLILMRYFNRWIPLLFVGSLMSSCTCHQQVEEVAKAPTSMDHPVGFSARPTTVVFPTVASIQSGDAERYWVGTMEGLLVGQERRWFELGRSDPVRSR